MVTGHDSLGYFADRYGCHVIGAIVPSLSSTAEASAKDLANLLDIAEDAHVNAIFTKLRLADAPVHRRVAAVLTFLQNAP